MTYHLANKLVISPTSPPSNYNLENSECILEDSSIPTAVNSALTKSNGEISAVNISKKDPTYIFSIHHAINDLQTRISDLNKTDIASTKKHKIVLLGDSHIKGISAFLNCELNNNYEILSLAKPGANSSILKDSLMESTGCGRNNSHIWRDHCSGCGGGTVMGGVSLVICGLAIFR